MSDSTLQFDTELSELRSMLSNDGFGLEAIGKSPAGVDLQVTVISDDACADCLVPKPLMRDLITARLAQFDLQLGELTYPVDMESHA
jgi:hypothetical protein